MSTSSNLHISSMSELNLRPRFKIETALTTDQAEERIRRLLKGGPCYETTFTRGHYVIRIPEAERHYWSPQMDISVYYDDYHETTQVRCLLAPAPAVWTMFMFFYSFVGFGVLFGLLIGSSQYRLDQYPWGFWMALVSFILFVMLFGVAQFGKSLSKEEMRRMKNFIYQVEW